MSAPDKVSPVDYDRVKGIIESLLISSELPLTLQQIYSCLGFGTAEMYEEMVRQLNIDYRETGRSFEIQKIAGGFQIYTLPQYARYVEKLWIGRRHSGLTRNALEALAIVAYRQPATRLEIEEIRGVNCDSVLQGLLEKGLLKVTGRKKAPGRPLLYGTTGEFLQKFGLDSLKDLPQEKDFPKTASLLSESIS